MKLILHFEKHLHFGKTYYIFRKHDTFCENVLDFENAYYI